MSEVTRPLILGSRGAMGRRYAAILRYFEMEPLLCDVGDEIPEGFDGVIIATPSVMHVQHVMEFLPYRVPILVEKPLAFSLKAVDAVCRMAEANDIRLDMVNQYKFLKGVKGEGDLTFYDYWNHGRDGLAWDCISVLALAKGHAALGEKSPIWNCQINGASMSIADMDRAYIDMIGSWVDGFLTGHGTDYIRHAHQSVISYLGGKAH